MCGYIYVMWNCRMNFAWQQKIWGATFWDWKDSQIDYLGERHLFCLLSFTFSHSSCHLLWDGGPGQSASWWCLTGTSNRDADNIGCSWRKILQKCNSILIQALCSQKSPSKVSMQAAGLIVFVYLQEFCLVNGYINLWMQVSVGDNDVQAYVWVYPRHLSLFFQCVIVCVCFSVLQENSD